MSRNQVYLFLITGILFYACNSSKSIGLSVDNSYSPVSKDIFDIIVSLDDKFFNAYNTCNLNMIDSLLSEDIEFYHDLGGLSTSKTQLMDGLKNNICGKVTRVLQEGSIEVYPIKDYGAVQMGKHGFYNLAENNTIHYSKFVHIWRFNNNIWRLTRVVSLH